MKLLLPVALLLGLAPVSLFAGTVTLDFEGPTSYASIADFYNGGTDSAGVAGPNLGVTFGLDDLGLKNDELGPYFSNAPSPLGIMTPVGPDTAMDVAAGFTDLRFFYTSSDDVASGVQVWSDLGGQGRLLASFDLTKNADAGVADPFAHFDQRRTGPLGETAYSVTFANSVGFAGFDDIAVAAVPEPRSVSLVAAGLLGLLALRHRSGHRARGLPCS